MKGRSVFILLTELLEVEFDLVSEWIGIVGD
jgi:hypothetical protein